MFYLTGTNNPRFNVNSGSTIKFTAPTTGTYAGILFFQARNATADFSILNSDSNSIVEGAIYLKNTRLHLNSYGATSPNTNWTMYIVRGIEVNSHSNLDINFRIETSSVPLPAGLSSNNVVRLLK
jgi:hypothetical protein